MDERHYKIKDILTYFCQHDCVYHSDWEYVKDNAEVILHAMCQVEKLGEENNRTKILNDVETERNRQDYLHPAKLNLSMRFVTIMEEMGEVAEAMQDKNNEAIYRELIDATACCVRMAEQILEE